MKTRCHWRLWLYVIISEKVKNCKGTSQAKILENDMETKKIIYGSLLLADNIKFLESWWNNKHTFSNNKSIDFSNKLFMQQLLTL